MKLRIFFVAAISFSLISCSTLERTSVAGDVNRKLTSEAVIVNPHKIPGFSSRSCPNSIAGHENKNWWQLVDVAGVCAHKGNWQITDSLGQILADRFPGSPWGFYFMALAADSRNDMLRSFWLLEQASNKDKTLAIFPYQKGRIFLKNNEVENAIAEFEKALKLDQNLYEVDLFLGQIQLRNSNMKSASKHFRNVLKFEPFHREALMGEAKCLTSDGDYKLALDFLERVLSKNKNDVEALYEHAYILQTMSGNLEQALAEYQQILKSLDKSKDLQGQVITTNLVSIRVKEVTKLIETKLQQTTVAKRGSK